MGSTANSISAANDLVSLAPKYIDIRRGQFIAVTIGVWGFVPWKVLASASNFVRFHLHFISIRASSSSSWHTGSKKNMLMIS